MKNKLLLLNVLLSTLFLNTLGNWDSQLLYAVSRGDWRMATHCIQNGANINNTQFNPLLHATFLRKKEAIIFLLNNGANPNFMAGTFWDSPLMIAALPKNMNNGHIKNSQDYNESFWIAEILIKFGASPNQKNIIGINALSNAAFYKHIDMVKLFLNNGATEESIREALLYVQDKCQSLLLNQNYEEMGEYEPIRKMLLNRLVLTNILKNFIMRQVPQEFLNHYAQ